MVEFYPRASDLFRLEFVAAAPPLPLAKADEEDVRAAEVCYAIPALLAQQALDVSLREDFPHSMVDHQVSSPIFTRVL